MAQDTKNNIPQDEKNVWTTNKIKNQFKKLVIEYIDSVHSNNQFIYSLTEIRDFLKKQHEMPEIRSSTFYRYIKNMHIQKYKHPYNGKFYYDINDFADDTEESLLEFCLNFKKYNKTLYVTVAPHLGNLLAEFLNCNFNQNLFYSTYTQGLLACHYVGRKNAQESDLGISYLNPTYIKKEVRRIANAIKYNAN